MSPSTTNAHATAHVEVQGISKHYGGAQALEGIDLRIGEGTIHALVGENGAGKSTLGKIVAGAVHPDTGQLLLRGRPVAFRSPREAIRSGIAIMDQELALVPTVPVVDNVFMGVERARRGFVSQAQQRRLFEDFAARIGFPHGPRTPTWQLSTADQQKVAIMSALARDAELIVMDEPTAALTRAEAERLLQTVRELTRGGVTVVFVSHFLGDVLALADVVTVLKDGRLVRTSPAAQETEESLVTAMLGRSLELVFPDVPVPDPDAPVVLSARGLSRPPAFQDVDVDVRAGEIVGLAGLVGSGRTEIARALFGADPAHGVVRIEGRDLRRRTPGESIRAGLAMLPESRKDQGLVMLRSVVENVTMSHLSDVCRQGFVRRGHERRVAQRVLTSVDARMPGLGYPVSSLSGGNQQKVALAKWLVRTPRVLIADEPTRGVDVGAKRAIYEHLSSLAAEGIGILLISSELEEVLGLCHRILVVRGGRIVGEFDREQADEESVMRAAFGDTVRTTNGDPTR
jgi:ABC-type sugar transport system ATPase subunit